MNLAVFNQPNVSSLNIAHQSDDQSDSLRKSLRLARWPAERWPTEVVAGPESGLQTLPVNWGMNSIV